MVHVNQVGLNIDSENNNKQFLCNFKTFRSGYLGFENPIVRILLKVGNKRFFVYAKTIT